jgi:hypothetical protein
MPITSKIMLFRGVQDRLCQPLYDLAPVLIILGHSDIRSYISEDIEILECHIPENH